MPSRLPLKIAKPRREKEGRCCPVHRAWVRRHHCSVPDCDLLPIECAHVRGGTDGGTALKPSDRWAISLCRLHHAEQHQIGETAFEQKHALDLRAIAEEFARRSPHMRPEAVIQMDEGPVTDWPRSRSTVRNRGISCQHATSPHSLPLGGLHQRPVGP